MRWYYSFCLLGAVHLQGVSALQKAVMKADHQEVLFALINDRYVSLSSQEKERYLLKAQKACLAVIKERKDTMQVWNSWKDFGCCLMGLLRLHFAYEFLEKKLFGQAFCALLASACTISWGPSCPFQRFALAHSEVEAI